MQDKGSDGSSKILVEIIARAWCAACGDDPDREGPNWIADPNCVYGTAALAVLTAIKEAGYAVVPREPTPEMLSAADSAIPRFEAELDGSRVMGVDGALDCWNAMITAGEE